MRKIILIIFIQICMLFNHAVGQNKYKWRATRMQLKSNNLTWAEGLENEEDGKDDNRQPLAKIVLYIPLPNVKFSDDARIKKTGGHTSEYFAFVTAGYRCETQSIQITHPNAHPLEIIFEKFLKDKISGQNVYEIWVEVDTISGPKQYNPELKWYTGLGINTSFQFAPTANFGFDCRHWNLWASFSHSLSSSKELVVYNKDNIEQCRHNYHYMRVSLNSGWEWEPWDNKTPLFGIMPCIGLAWDRIYSKTKDEIGDGFNAYYILAGTRISLKTNNRRFCFFASPSLNLNIGSNPRKNFDIITNEIVDLKSNFDIQIGAIYYF